MPSLTRLAIPGGREETTAMDESNAELLIVDDEEGIHRALERTLRREPYELLHAYDAAEAWILLRDHPGIRGIVCDHYMPGTHGLVLLREVRARYPEVATLLLTAQADLELAIRSVNEGHVHRFLPKPWSGPRLRQELRELILGEVAGDPTREQIAQEEERLRDELAPMQDAESGAFLLDDPDET